MQVQRNKTTTTQVWFIITVEDYASQTLAAVRSLIKRRSAVQSSARKTPGHTAIEKG